MIAAVRAAVELAERQLAALRVGDIDGFLAGLDAYEGTCLSLAGLSPPEADLEARLLLERLLAIDRLVRAELARELNRVSVKLAAMRRGRNAAGAYFAGVTSALSGVREG